MYLLIRAISININFAFIVFCGVFLIVFHLGRKSYLANILNKREINNLTEINKTL